MPDRPGVIDPLTRPGTDGVPLCIYQQSGTCIPQDGALHGRQELNLTAETKTARWERPRERLLVSVYCLPRSLPGGQGYAQLRKRGHGDMPLVLPVA